MKDTQSLHHVFILMGVSGSGKSAVANGVAQRIGAAFLDMAISFILVQNITKMASQVMLLNDEDRKPWLHALNDDAAFCNAKNQ